MTLTRSLRHGQLFAYALLILWIGVILLLGSGPGSMAQTSRFIGPLIEFFFASASPDTFLIVHAFIRKAAHFFEYAVLAILAAQAFRYSDSDVSTKYWFGLSLVLVAVVASVDEFNQSFQASRTSSGWDVVLDIVGGLTALTVIYLVRRRKSNGAG